VFQEASAYLAKRFEGLLASVTEVAKENLEMLNHLSGENTTFASLSFFCMSQCGILVSRAIFAYLMNV
jgi:hypothetical protein